MSAQPFDDFLDELHVRDMIEARLREMCQLGLVCQNTAGCPYRKDGPEPCDYPFIGNEHAPVVRHIKET